MPEPLQGLDRIAAAVRGSVEPYATLVRELAGANAKSLAFFGAVVAGSFDLQRHSARSVLVLEAVDLGLLRRLAERGVKLGKSHISAPLIMTPSYILASCDTFALELIEIQQQHVTVFGEDFFANLSFEDSHVRLQCERELKVALIGLRQGLLAAAGRESALAPVVDQVIENMTRTLRGLLWLKGQKEEKPAKDVIADVEKMCNRELSGLAEALNRTAATTWLAFENLYRDVEAMKKFVDAK
ncbi:MAG: hypothetical protein AABZ47_15055 [Planctomycetota bacterium]